MSVKSLTLSIVIPVYNEENYIANCLDSIARQAVQPDEVIVVNNNSTDKSLDIIKRYKFVKLLHELRQHQAFAQKTGFNAAKGDIIGRIDADSVLPPDWVSKVKQAFETDNDTVAIFGGAWPYDTHLKWPSVAVFRLYNIYASLLAGHPMLWGANCALRRQTWIKIRGQVLQRPDIWEDYDMSFLLARYGEIRFLRGIRIGTSFRSIHKPFITQVRYQFCSVKTFYLRTSVIRAAILFVFWCTMIVFYPIALFDRLIPMSKLPRGNQ
jgi:glycosyltransferase involved in cell wall biosynthesis